MTVQEIVDRCQALFDDLDFNAVKDWKAANPAGKAIGYLPIYVPREIIHAAGMLPVGIFGGGDQLEVIHGDAYYQSYICRIPRSTIELGLTGRLDSLDGMLFPSICDVIRNLSGMWQLLFKDKYVKYFDLPQTYKDDIGGAFYIHEMQTLREDLGKLAGREIADEDLQNSIAVYNENRQVINELYQMRAKQPWQAPTSEIYLLLRAGMVLPVEEHSRLLWDYLAGAETEDRPMRDNCRIILQGSFCEQPPFDMVRMLGRSSYVVDDDFLIGLRWILSDIPVGEDPLQDLAHAYVEDSSYSPVQHDLRKRKENMLIERVRNSKADAVIVTAAKMCEPGLEEQVAYIHGLDKEGIPFFVSEFEENQSSFADLELQLETFMENLLFA